MREQDYWTDERMRETIVFTHGRPPWTMKESFILDAKYESKTPKEIVATMKHLSAPQRGKDGTRCLDNFRNCLMANLAGYKGPQVHLEVDSNVLPTHSKAYSVPEIHKNAYLRELKHLVEIGVLRVCGPTEWAAPSFIIPKKDGRVRWLTDFRNLNKALKRKQYPLPLIHEIVSRRRGYKFFTKIDLTMMYYAFELDEYSKELCTIVTPFGKFQYNRLPMGLKISPTKHSSASNKFCKDWMLRSTSMMWGIFSNAWEEHCTLVTQVLSRLQAAGLKVVPEKCEWAVQETDFLGHWLTPTGTKPWAKKVDAVLRMQRPQTLTQLRAFIGAVTYYRHMFPRRSHLLAPLTRLTGSTRFEWTPDCDKAFNEMKALLASDCLMQFPNPNLPYDLYSDASDYQMGAVIMQNGRPVAYWSRKLSPAQQNYSVMEKEMLSIVMCLKEYYSMLYGMTLTIFTDHKNLTFPTLNTQRVLRWRMFLEEFSPTFRYCPGKDNVLADCFSRLPRMDKPSSGRNVLRRGKLVAFDKMKVPDLSADEIYAYEELVAPPERTRPTQGHAVQVLVLP